MLRLESLRATEQVLTDFLSNGLLEGLKSCTKALRACRGETNQIPWIATLGLAGPVSLAAVLI